MTRFLLDTDIISEAVKLRPAQAVLDWFSTQEDGDLFVSTLTVAEIHRGILDLPTGRKRRVLEDWFAGPEGPLQLFAGRVLAFDAPAALCWARLMAQGRAEKRSRSPLDTIIAAIAQANDCVVVTANLRHFPDVRAFDPRGGRSEAFTPQAPS